MKGKMNTSNQGSTDTPMGKKAGKGAGANKRDASIATAVKGGGTQHLRAGQVTRSKGSFKSYK